MTDLSSSTVVVTGGSRGYGAGIAASFAKAGAKVWITGRNEVKLREAADRIGARHRVADASDGAAWDGLFEEVLGATGRLDVLVNNAGEGVKIGEAAVQDDASVERSLASNLTGAILGCTRAARIMSGQGSGLIVNIGSACSTHAWAGWGVYSAAKAGLLMFSRCLLAELRPHGVRVTSILPSWGQTDFTEGAHLPPRDPEVLAKCIAPGELGDLIVQIARLPAHLVTEEVKLWPTVQPIGQL
ncbi:MAG: SDR family oxidoreductase [Verrucomicrobia bacterium]|nr:SDR family oxidoreductase [Verrucomicrobiota bacterium]